MFSTIWTDHMSSQNENKQVFWKVIIIFYHTNNNYLFMYVYVT